MSFSLQRNVLLVDDEPSFLEVTGELFEHWSKGSWKVHSATNTAKALSILDGQSIDLIVIDWHMPVVDGGQFLKLIEKKCPGLPKAILTGHGSENIRMTSLELGADLFLEKPRQTEALESVFAALNELAKCHTQEGFRGLLRQVSLSDVLQMECLGRNSCVLELSASHQQGKIFIKKGEILHAEVGEFSGEEAFHELFGMRGGNFSLLPFVEPAGRTIEANWEMLVMEAARRRDELGELEPPPARVARAKTQTEASSLEAWLALAGQSSSRAASNVSPAPSTEIGPRTIDEVIVRSRQGEVIYAFNAGDIEGRVKLMALLDQKAAQIAGQWSLGIMDRLEVEGLSGRVVVQVQAERQVWVRAHPGDDAADDSTPAGPAAPLRMQS